MPNEARLGYLFAAPAVLLLGTLVGYPFLMSLYLALTNAHVGAPGAFIGFGNYSALLNDDVFRQTVWNSVLYTTVSVSIKLVLGIALALLLYGVPHGKLLFRGLLLLPWIVPSSLSVLAWWWMYTPPYSVANWLLLHLGAIRQAIPWLSDPTWARVGIITVNVWRGLPFFAITFLAGLMSLPRELFEAAEVDGAGPFLQFWSVVLPLLRPLLCIVVLYSVVMTVSDFEGVFIITRGGPMNSTHLFSTLAYQVGLNGTMLGRGAAISLFIFPMLAASAFFLLRLIESAAEHA